MKEYNESFYIEESKIALSSAEIIMPFVIKRLKCNTIIDFGCGTGEWLNVAKKCASVERTLGLDGEYVKEYLKINQNEFIGCNLATEIDLKEKFDLAISLEVAEHMPEKSAKIFINNLTKHSDIILFSAAVPYQGGTTHVNEKYPSYWENIFKEYGFSMVDCLRTTFWNDKRIVAHYRQNIFICCKQEYKKKIEEIFFIKKRSIDIIHPDMWEIKHTHRFLFPFERVERGENIVIYGAGVVGREYVNQVLGTKYAKVVLWCDSAFEDCAYLNAGIENPEKIKDCKYDKIVIAMSAEKNVLEVMNVLCNLEVEQEKIIWREPKYERKYIG